MSDNPQDKKIIIDEDWKSQVEKEREQFKKQHAGAKPGGSEKPVDSGKSGDSEVFGGSETPPDTNAAADAEVGEPHKTYIAEPEDLPEASFHVLMSMMTAPIMSSLGQLPDPTSGKAVIRLDLAKLQIDMLSLLQEKTKGNLSDDEADLLHEALHQFRMAFLAIQSEIANQTTN